MAASVAALPSTAAPRRRESLPMRELLKTQIPGLAVLESQSHPAGPPSSHHPAAVSPLGHSMERFAPGANMILGVGDTQRTHSRAFVPNRTSRPPRKAGPPLPLPCSLTSPLAGSSGTACPIIAAPFLFRIELSIRFYVSLSHL